MTTKRSHAHFMTGFESTYMPGIGTDVLEGTRHNERFLHDFGLVQDLGITTIRYPASWNYVERTPGQFDWDLLDRKLHALQARGIAPILDLVHHTSVPEGVFPAGFADPDFPTRLAEFAGRCAERYPWITTYTVFNEPYLTTQFCGEFGVWFPYHKGPQAFVAMLMNVCRGIVLAAERLREIVPGVEFMHPDTCERHRALNPADREAALAAALANARRFLVDDLLLGGVDADHGFHRYLIDNGVRDGDLAWFAGRASPIDIRGLDYYRQSEWEYISATEKRWAEHRVGFRAVAEDYIAHLGLPVMLSETNFFGTPAERLSWLRGMLEDYDVLAAAHPDIRGFCWFPFISSTDFQHMLLQYRNDVDPVGIYDLDAERWHRIRTELVDVIGEMARRP
jgi:dTDP-4-dehydrorhamnose reductase